MARLATEYLVRRHGPGERYVMHDLVRAFALRLAREEDSASARRASITRLLDHHRLAAAQAMDLTHPSERHRRPSLPEVAASPPPLPDATSAKRWLDAESANLLSFIRAAESG